MSGRPVSPSEAEHVGVRQAARSSRIKKSRLFAEVSERSGRRPFDLASAPMGSGREAPIALRRKQGFRELQPVANIVRTIERMGIGVVTELTELRDGEQQHEVPELTMPSMHNTCPVVATLSILRGDLQRLTLAQELGHIVFDGSAATIACKRHSPEELRAFEFGSAFLLSSVVVRSASPRRQRSATT